MNRVCGAFLRMYLQVKHWWILKEIEFDKSFGLAVFFLACCTRHALTHMQLARNIPFRALPIKSLRCVGLMNVKTVKLGLQPLDSSSSTSF